MAKNGECFENIDDMARLSIFSRRQHRRIALRPMTPKAMQAYGHVLDYEARIMIRTLLNETRHVGLPINPTHYVRRYIFKYDPILSLLVLK